MRLLVVAVAAVPFAVVFRKAIKKAPVAFYALAIAFDVLFAYGIAFSLPPMLWAVVSIAVQRCTIATVLFAIVMYIGVFPEGSAMRKMLMPIRSELSIIACILAFGHSLNYLNSYVGVLLGNVSVLAINQLLSLVCAIVLFVLLLALFATSFMAIRRHMHALTWKKIQRSAYVFYAAIYIHAILILYPSVLAGAGDALEACIAYTALFLPYPFLRVHRHLADRRAASKDVNLDKAVA